MKRRKGVEGKLDDIFSKLVRERENWTCERCAKYFPEGTRMGLHCSHYYSRRHRHTRWHPDNAFAHCYACHSYLGGNPKKFVQWAEQRMGEGLAEILLELHNCTDKITASDKEEMFEFYKKEYATMLMKRKNGNVGRIDFRNAT